MSVAGRKGPELRSSYTPWRAQAGEAESWSHESQVQLGRELGTAGLQFRPCHSSLLMAFAVRIARTDQLKHLRFGVEFFRTSCGSLSALSCGTAFCNCECHVRSCLRGFCLPRNVGPFNSDTLATQRHILSWVYQDD